MSNHLLQSRRQSFFGKSRKSRARKSGRSEGRTLAMESLESRQMMSVTPLQNFSFSQDAGEKPQSKMFEYAGQWWSVMPIKTGTWLFRLDGSTWTATQKISASKSTHSDVKIVDDFAHVLLYEGAKSQYATLQYDAVDNRFEPWSQQPNLVNVPLSKGVETATIEADSTGRLWIASDAKSTVEVRYSDGLHTTWSAPITIASGIKSDDISTIIAMPNGSIGVFWSNQSTKLFGFKVHQDGDPVNVWSADEKPGSQSALNVGKGMADDHMHAAVISNGTVYVAVKTSYDKSGYPKMGLLVRRPNGLWDNFYGIDDSGTRPVMAVSEAANQLIIAHTTKEGGGDIVYYTSPLDVISFAPQQLLIKGKVNNVTTTKMTSSNQVAFLANSKSVLFTFDVAAPIVNSFSTTAGLNLLSSSQTTGPTANDLALEDPSLVDEVKYSQPAGTSLNQTVGTSI